MSVGPNPPRAIPLSPESPPSEGIKEAITSRLPQKRPETPQSPALSMNFSNQNNALTSTSPQTASSQATSYPQSFSSPPTTQSVDQSPMVSKDPGSSKKHLKNAENSIDTSITTPNESDDRTTQSSGAKRAADIAMGVDDTELGQSPHKRQRVSGPPFDNGPKSPPSDPSIASQSQPTSVEKTLEEVQRNMGSAFFLCRKPHQPVRPYPHQSLLSVYNMQDLVASVAREDPITKEKINKLRKSYDGQLKELGLSGRNKNYPLPDGREGLRAMYAFPDEDWESLRVRGRSIGLSPTLGESLQSAVTLAPGPCRNQETWDNKIGHEPPKSRMTGTEPKKPVAAFAPTRMNGVTSVPVRAQADDRPKRTGRKRSYKDDSFDGYAEAYGDEDDDEVALKSGSEDGSRGLGRKRRKKDTYTTASPVTMEGRVEAIGIGR